MTTGKTAEKTKLYDVIVAGAGPAGASAARAAAQAGLSVLAIDKDRFPRFKPCAGALSCMTLHLLDFELPPDVVERDFHGGLLCFKDHCINVQRPYRAGVLVKRPLFDALLVDKARESGAGVIEGVRVTGMAQTHHGVRVATDAGEFEGRFLIVAEGSTGRLKLAVRPRDPRNDQIFALCADAPGKGSGNGNRDPLTIRFDMAVMGYGWVFPRDDYASVGFGECAAYIKDPKAVMNNLLDTFGYSGEQRVVGHSIPMGGIKRAVAHGRVLLVGDAAGFADALLGEGIGYAVQSGILAATSVHDHLTAGARGDIQSCYTEACEKVFGGELRHTLLLARSLRKLPDWLLRGVITDKKALGWYIDVIARKGTFRELNHRLARRIPLYALRGALLALKGPK